MMKPQYGLTDSGDYWHHTHSLFLLDYLEISRTTGDLSLFYKMNKGLFSEIFGAYADDTLWARDRNFEKESKKMKDKF